MQRQKQDLYMLRDTRETESFPYGMPLLNFLLQMPKHQERQLQVLSYPQGKELTASGEATSLSLHSRETYQICAFL